MILDLVEQTIDACASDPARPLADAEFNRLALDVFAHQYDNVTLYRRLS
jgi:hypothetical protein